jgi:hypothetical protein
MTTMLCGHANLGLVGGCAEEDLEGVGVLDLDAAQPNSSGRRLLGLGFAAAAGLVAVAALAAAARILDISTAVLAAPTAAAAALLCCCRARVLAATARVRARVRAGRLACLAAAGVLLLLFLEILLESELKGELRVRTDLTHGHVCCYPMMLRCIMRSAIWSLSARVLPLILSSSSSSSSSSSGWPRPFIL